MRACLPPEKVCLEESGSFRNIAPENPVRIGVINVNAFASDSDRYWREKYKPARPTKLQDD
jgi:hypothetical protein